MGEGDTSFVETANIVTDGDVLLRKFKSKVSGLSVCIAETEGPIVAGYLCVATEAHDDDGLPHTLEHLVFMGSEKYPYKGVLDILSNFCLASGTNAWTDTDHTCYTMRTAGQEGFLKLLPIYVDHLLYPTLSDSAYVTEVHHVNSEGEDGGVVYCEMQGRLSSGESQCHIEMLRAMYPGDCGYKSEIGGLLENLRESTTNEKVKAFHKDFYRPENLSIIIIGQIDTEEVFKVLQPIEDHIAAQGERSPFSKPWQSAVPPLPESVSIDVNYPCDEDDFGLAIAAWRGPTVEDYSQLISMQILMEYLADTSVSPLQQTFVECTDPLCSSVDYNIIENSVTCVYLHFANVPVEKLAFVKNRLLDLLKSIANCEEEFDMRRMATVIHKKELHILSRMESYPHEHLAMYLIGDILYGTGIEDLEQRVCQIPIIQKLAKEDSAYWCSLLKLYMVEGLSVVVLGYPSPQRAKEAAAEEKERVEKQKENLGTEGLKLKGQTLTLSIQANEVLPPEEVMRSISVPSVQSVQFHNIQRFNNWTESSDYIENFPLSEMPCRFQLDVVKTSFVRMYALLDTGDVPQELRMFLPIFVELIAESPVCRNGEIIPYQDVVRQLDADTISSSVSLGLNSSRFICDNYAQVICVELMLEEKQYLKGINWIREILFHTVFEATRIKTIANKMLTDVASMRREGGFVTKTGMINLYYDSESNHWASSMMRQYKFLVDLSSKLQSDPDEVVKTFDELRKILTDVGKLTIHLALGQSSLKESTFSVEPWVTDLLPPDKKPSKMKTYIKQCYELIKNFSSVPQGGVIIGLSCIETSILLLSAPCIKSFKHPDYPALLTILQYLNQVEGPLWRQLRGMGLTYCSNLYTKTNQGLIHFFLYNSTFPVKAYRECLRIVESYLNKDVPWDPSLLEAAQSSLVFEIVEKERAVAGIVEQSVSAYYKGVDSNFTKELLQSISKVTFEDMEKAGALYLKPLFDPKLSKCSICCHPSKVDEIVSGFRELSVELTVLTSLEDSFYTHY